MTRKKTKPNRYNDPIDSHDDSMDINDTVQNEYTVTFKKGLVTKIKYKLALVYANKKVRYGDLGSVVSVKDSSGKELKP